MLYYRLCLEKERLEEEWKAERVLIKEEFESKIGTLNETITGSEGQIKVAFISIIKPSAVFKKKLL